MIRKCALLALFTLGFGLSLLFLQDRLTKEEYLTSVEVTLQVSTPFAQLPQFLRVTPGGEFDDAKEWFQTTPNGYSFRFSRIAQSVAFRVFEARDRDKLINVAVKVGSEDHLFSGDLFTRSWEWKPEAEGGLWVLKDRIVAVGSVLRFLGDRFRVMNWPGDLTVLTRFVSDQSSILAIHLALFLMGVLLIFFEDRIVRFLDRGRFSLPTQGWPLFATLVLVALVVRHATLTLISSGDQATYLTIGHLMNQGSLLYRDVWDTKSPGFFLFYSWILRLGSNLFVLNLAGTLLIAATGWALAKIARTLGTAPLFTGVTYVLISSVFETNFAVTPEQLVVLCSSLAILSILRGTTLSLFFSGLFLGCAFVCKYPAGLEFVGLGLWWFFLSIRRRLTVNRLVAGAFCAMAGALSVVFAVVLWFVLNGNFVHLWQDNILFDLFHYAGKNTLAGVLQTLLFFVRTYFVFVVLAAIGFAVILRNRKTSDLGLLLAFWTPVSVMAILMPAQGEVQYWFQLWGVLALSVPFGLEWLNRKSLPRGLLLPAALMILFLTASARIEYDKPDLANEVSTFLRPMLTPADKIFVLSGNAQAAYFLLDRAPPTKYVHGYARPEAEMERIFSLSPRFLVLGGDYAFKARWRIELKSYHLARRISYVEIYERNSPS